MKSLLEYLVLNIVDQPDKVVIEAKEETGHLNLSLKTDPEDMGKIIGRGGKTIKALRILLRVKGILQKKGVNLNLVESETPSP